VTDDRLTIPLTDQQRAAALRLTEAGHELFESTHSVALETRVVKEMPRAAFLFMATLLSTGTASAYDVYKRVREQNARAGRDRLHLPVNAAYRAASWLKEICYIEVADIADGATNSIKKTVYRLTERGARALKEEGLRQVQLALAWIPHEHAIAEAVPDEADLAVAGERC
jgi:hypothetical protein